MARTEHVSSCRRLKRWPIYLMAFCFVPAMLGQRWLWSFSSHSGTPSRRVPLAWDSSEVHLAGSIKILLPPACLCSVRFVPEDCLCCHLMRSKDTEYFLVSPCVVVKWTCIPISTILEIPNIKDWINTFCYVETNKVSPLTCLISMEHRHSWILADFAFCQLDFITLSTKIEMRECCYNGSLHFEGFHTSLSLPS